MLIGATAWFDSDGALDFEPILVLEMHAHPGL